MMPPIRRQDDRVAIARRRGDSRGADSRSRDRCEEKRRGEKENYVQNGTRATPGTACRAVNEYLALAVAASGPGGAWVAPKAGPAVGASPPLWTANGCYSGGLWWRPEGVLWIGREVVTMGRRSVANLSQKEGRWPVVDSFAALRTARRVALADGNETNSFDEVFGPES